MMPFGLTNAPTIFNRLMIDVFCKQLDDFVLVFFDDILIYSKKEEEHAQHVRCVLELVTEEQPLCKKE